MAFIKYYKIIFIFDKCHILIRTKFARIIIVHKVNHFDIKKTQSDLIYLKHQRVLEGNLVS